jgi:hypothetical protein
MIDLQRLAPVLEKHGFGVSPIEEPPGLTIAWPHASGIGAYIVHYYGTEECPALAFAMLDVLRMSGLWVDQSAAPPQSVDANPRGEAYGVEISDYVKATSGDTRFWKVVVAEYGATRTEAIALALIAATDAGLISSGKVENA